jgi:hypothetical protein
MIHCRQPRFTNSARLDLIGALEARAPNLRLLLLAFEIVGTRCEVEKAFMSTRADTPPSARSRCREPQFRPPAAGVSEGELETVTRRIFREEVKRLSTAMLKDLADTKRRNSFTLRGRAAFARARC